jgi:putative intracellular protease/amidase
MKIHLRHAASLLLALTLFAAAAAATWLAFSAAPAAAADAAQRWVCPPCAAPCDTLTFAAAGICPQCGMKLVLASAVPPPDPNQKKVAILVFNSCEILDFTGPYEMFGAAGADVYTVAATKDPITTAMGLTVVPKFTFATAPQPDVLVIPGGGVRAAAKDDATLAYIKSVTEHTKNTMSVCNGAFILANTGLLDGLSATTTYGNILRLRDGYPKIKVVEDQRYVDNGHLITTAGLSAGIDGALHVIDRLYGRGYAEQVALGEEVDWKPTPDFARAALADHQIPQVKIDDWGKWDVVRTEGDTRHWDLDITGHSELAATDLTSKIEDALTAAQWKRVGSGGKGVQSHSSDWRFTGTDGKAWKATFKIESTTSEHDFNAGIAVTRGS